MYMLAIPAGLKKLFGVSSHTDSSSVSSTTDVEEILALNTSPDLSVTQVEVSNEGINLNVLTTSSVQLVPDTTSVENNENSAGSGKQPNDEENDEDITIERTKVVGGTITNLEEGMKDGIVDTFYRFNQKDFGTTFRLGDKVNYIAEQNNQTFEWRVKQMSHFVSEKELQIQENSRYSTFLCQVICTKSNYITVSVPEHTEISIPKAKLPKDYEIKVGDFLEVKTEVVGQIPLNSNLNDVVKGKFLSVKPSKTKIVVNGKVVRHGRFGQLCIDHYILIHPEFIVGTDFPRIGSLCYAECVETSQENGLFSWRVTKISRSKFSKYKEEDAEEWDSRESLNEEVRNYIEKLLEDKCGVNIVPAKKIDFRNTKVGSVTEKPIEISNTSTRTYTLRNVEMQSDQGVCKFDIKLPRTEGPDTIVVLHPGKSFNIKITCTPLLTGSTKELCKFDFGEFCIGRYVHAKSVPLDNSTVKLLTNGRIRGKRNTKLFRAESESQRRSQALNNRTRIPGIKAVRGAFFLPKRLPLYDCPTCVSNALKENKAQHLFDMFPSLKVTELQESLTVTFERYKDMFQVALWFEEIEHQRKRDKHVLWNVTLFRSADSMYFEVSCLEDFQPPLTLGEGISVCDAENPDGNIYEANVIKISDNKVFGKYDRKFHEEYKGNPMTVRFRLGGRSAYRRWHYAIANAPKFLGKDWLFPGTVKIKPPRFTFIEDDDGDDSDENIGLVLLQRKKSRVRATRRPKMLDIRESNCYPMPFIEETGQTLEQINISPEVKLKWFKQNLNEEQKNAVRRILRGQCRPIPYIIFGPPGTGKTVTVVEAVMQINKLDRNSRILVTAPSNAAADLIAEYLVASCKFRPGDFVRFNGYQREEISISDTIADFCFDGSNLQNIARNRIVISTCNTAGQFFNLGITAGHFTHVFLDEAGNCHEPDSIIPALFVSLGIKGQFIMAGDPNQLGPSLISDAAEYYGLEVSFLERLMNLPLYQRDKKTKEYNPVLLTKLLRNYRSHELLLKLPSKLFYDDELIFAASKIDTESLCHTLDFLPKRGVPLIFHGIRGDEARDSDSPSWYNALEVIQVVDYVKKLMNNCCTSDDIGIISPYRKQVDKIRQAIRKELGCQMPKVGSVQEFQGGERKIVIVSLVRSRDSEDASTIPINKFEFLFSPKRFNVAVTRAKAILIVVGNPHLFWNNLIWYKFIKYCIEMGAYVGCDLPIQLDTHLQKSLVTRENGNHRSVVNNSPPSSSGEESDSDSTDTE